MGYAMGVTRFAYSRMMLGTVQWGMQYGVANRTGQPTHGQVREIMELALAEGINCFDTAAAYGNSEDVLGQLLGELAVQDQVCVVTKVRPLTVEERTDPARGAKAAEDSVAASRHKLGLEQLPLVLLHRPEDVVCQSTLQRLQKRGWIGQWGVSCDHQPDVSLQLLRDDDVSALQIPASLLDRRHLEAGLLAAAEARGVCLFVRSLYLQGLLTMPTEEIPAHLQDIHPARQQLEQIAETAGLPLRELALRYFLSISGVTSLVVGVETVTQLRSNLEIVNRGPLPQVVQQALEAFRPNLEESLITPSLWPARQQ